MMVEKEFLTISEVSLIAGVEIHTLRYWEKEFSSFLRPLRTNGGQRRYDERCIDVILTINRLLKEDEYTIAGAKKVLRENSYQKKDYLAEVHQAVL